MTHARRSFLLTFTVALPIAILAVLTGVPDSAPAFFSTRFAGVPVSVWLCLSIMGALAAGAWFGLAIRDGDAEPRE